MLLGRGDEKLKFDTSLGQVLKVHEQFSIVHADGELVGMGRHVVCQVRAGLGLVFLVEIGGSQTQMVLLQRRIEGEALFVPTDGLLRLTLLHRQLPLFPALSGLACPSRSQTEFGNEGGHGLAAEAEQ